jgi:hypothetical protein
MTMITHNKTSWTNKKPGLTFQSMLDSWREYYLNPNAEGMVFIIARLIANNHAIR